MSDSASSHLGNSLKTRRSVPPSLQLPLLIRLTRCARADKQRRTSGVVGGTSRPDVSFFYELDGKTVSIDAKETSGPQKYQFDAVFPPDRAPLLPPFAAHTRLFWHPHSPCTRTRGPAPRPLRSAARQFRSAVSGRTLCVGRTGASHSRKSTSMRRNRPSRMSSAGLTAPFSPTAKSVCSP